TAAAPSGSLAAQTSIDSAFTTTTETNSYSFTAAPGQRLTIALIPNTYLPATQITLKDPNGNPLATATSSNSDGVVIENVATTTGGTYELDVADVGNALGAYTIRVLNNGIYNPVIVNSTPGAAPVQNLDSSFASLGGTAALTSVIGNASAGNND